MSDRSIRFIEFAVLPLSKDGEPSNILINIDSIVAIYPAANGNAQIALANGRFHISTTPYNDLVAQLDDFGKLITHVYTLPTSQTPPAPKSAEHPPLG